MIICHDPKFVYYAPPKTGTTTLDTIFRERGFIGTEERDDKHRITSAIALASAQDYHFFITVRNPFTRIVSCWRYIQARKQWSTMVHQVMHEQLSGVSFRNFVLNTDWSARPLADMLRPQADYRTAMPVCHQIIRLEDFERGVRALPFLPDDQVVPFENSTNSNLLDKHYGLQVARRVADFYRDDFIAFGYSQHDWMKR